MPLHSKVITVFRTDIDYLKKGLEEENAPIPRLSDYDCYPFLPLADPDGSVASKYQIESKGLSSHVADLYHDYSTLVGAHKSCTNLVTLTGMKQELKHFSAAFMLPSEFLIDENGVIVDVLRGQKAIDSMEMDRVSTFLLSGVDAPRSRKSEGDISDEGDIAKFKFDKNNKRLTA